MPLPVLKNTFLTTFTAPSSNKPTADTHITLPVSINTYQIMLKTSLDIN